MAIGSWWQTLVGPGRASPQAAVEPPRRGLTQLWSFAGGDGCTLEIAAARWGHRLHDELDEPFAVGPLPDGGAALALCDGSGDWGDGVQASRAVVRRLAASLGAAQGSFEDGLAQAFADAQQVLRTQFPGDDFGSSCSAIAALVDGGQARVGWSGGCEAQLLRAGALAEHTEAHLLWRENKEHGAALRDRPEGAVVTRSLTSDGEVRTPGVSPAWTLEPGDVLLLGSIELGRRLTAEQLGQLVVPGDAAASLHAVLEATFAVDRYHEAAAVVLTVKP
ncbi:MAG: hypothetical protein K1X89_24290 [Myxococcaceae bacterium]|nr:hypothetical protein [Myxococcaceae bacterium]